MSESNGIKYDGEKPQYALIPAFALDEVAKCLTYGAKKYAPDNWRHVDEAQRRYFDAAQRHLWAIARCEDIDPESGLHHASHAIVSMMFYLEIAMEKHHTQSSFIQHKHTITQK